MRLSKTISQLKKVRDAAAAFSATSDAAGRLSELTGFQNPGNLRGLYYLPENMGSQAPLVVVLHGCTQNAAGYDQGAGWSRLADRHGFALLFPEQQRANNPNLCFNWYQDEDSRRGSGEAASIRAMVETMAAAHGIDRKRVFVTGLSAGGAMASVMLAAYPELFAGGAIIAGLPYGCASNVGEAFGCMSGRAPAETAELAASVRAASAHKGPWPRISVWQGSADYTVVPSNADSIVRQWVGVHGLAAQPARTETVEGYPRRVWLGADGEELIEQYVITGMAHGTPLMPGTEEGQSGEAGAHMLDAAISSTDRIAAFFGIAPEPAQRPKSAQAREDVSPSPAWSAQPATAGGPQKVIEDALKAAGLMR
jgi:poly(hydroxyalkanoate) depolymerase family esterase